jgi:hypothetical protein
MISVHNYQSRHRSTTVNESQFQEEAAMTEKVPHRQLDPTTDDDVSGFVVEGGCVPTIGNRFQAPPRMQFGPSVALKGISNPHWDIAVVR